MVENEDWKKIQRRKDIRFFSILAAYLIIGFIVFGHFSKQEYITQDCPIEPGIERGVCYQQNALFAILKGIGWPVYTPAKFLIYIGRNI